MAHLELLCAPAGTGKTHHCIEEFKNALLASHNGLLNQSWFILPTAEHAERVNDLVLRDPNVQGFFNLHVTTVNAFIRNIVKPFEQSVASDLVKATFLGDLLAQGEWPYFQFVQNRSGFISILADFITELKTSFVTLHDLQKAAQPLLRQSEAARLKFKDLAVLLQRYEAQLEQSGLIDFDDEIRRFVSSVEKNVFQPPAFDAIWMDGFYDFSAAQLEFIKILSRYAARMVITLTVDPPGERNALFQVTHETAKRLKRIGFREKYFTDLRNWRTTTPVLSHLTDQVFCTDVKAGPQPDPSLRIFEATGLGGEMEMVAHELVRLYRNGQYQWSDFCLVLRHIGSYEPVIRSVFEEFGIPVEVHERRMLKMSAFAKVFVHVVELYRKNWPRENLMAILKNAAWGLFSEEVFEFEKEIEEAGIFDGREAWFAFLKNNSKQNGKERSERFLKVMSDLRSCEDELRQPKTAAAFTKAVRGMIRRFRLFSDFFRRTDEVGREEAHAFCRFEQILLEIEINFSQPYVGARHALPLLSFDQYTDMLLKGIEVALFSVRCLDRNRVQVYDVSTARQKEYRVVFVAGLLERIFPRQIREDPILKDDERHLLNEGKELLRERLVRTFVERYLFYLALTRARERLYLTYPRFDIEGKEALPSFYVEEVKKLFRSPVRIEQQRLSDVVLPLQQVSRKTELYAGIVSGLFEKKAQARKDIREVLLALRLYNEVCSDLEFRRVLEGIARDARPAEIQDEQIRLWFKQPRESYSPTGLETFARCPFRYFLEKVCRLQERRPEIDLMDMGEVLHRVLEKFFQLTAKGQVKEKWIVLEDPERAKQWILDKLDEVLRQDFFAGAKSYRKQLVKDVLAELLVQFLEKEKKVEQERRTVPTFFELKFGRFFKGEQGVGYLRIPSQEGEILIGGKIDRIDLEPKTRVGVVIDYKLGKSFKMDLVEKGIDLQLPLYVLVLEEVMNYVAAGAELYSLREAQRSGFYNKVCVDQIGKVSSRTGLLSEAEFRKVLEGTKANVRDFVRRLREADIRIRPRICDFCSCEHVCRFEKWRLIYLEMDEREGKRRKSSV